MIDPNDRANMAISSSMNGMNHNTDMNSVQLPQADTVEAIDFHNKQMKDLDASFAEAVDNSRARLKNLSMIQNPVAAGTSVNR